jgi:hypothetical protein
MLRILLSHPLFCAYFAVVSTLLFAALFSRPDGEQRARERSRAYVREEGAHLLQAWTGPCPNPTCLWPLDNLRRRGGAPDCLRLAGGAPDYAALFREAVTRIAPPELGRQDG